MFKLLTTAIVAVSAFAIPATAGAQDATPCPDGYTPVESVGGPLCVNPIYLDGTWNDDPTTCAYGYYQGSCAPPVPAEPAEPLPVEAYTYQMDTPSPAYVAEVAAKVAVWLGDIQLTRGLHVR